MHFSFFYPLAQIRKWRGTNFAKISSLCGFIGRRIGKIQKFFLKVKNFFIVKVFLFCTLCFFGFFLSIGMLGEPKEENPFFFGKIGSDTILSPLTFEAGWIKISESIS